MALIQSFLEYLELERNYSSHTIAAYKRDITSFALFCDENDLDDISKVNYTEIRLWLVFLSNATISARTINRKVSALNTYYNYLLKIKERKTNPLAKHKALKVAQKVQVPFSSEELKDVFSIPIDESDFEAVRNVTIIKLLYSTGMRRAELINLKITAIDFAKQQIKVLGKRNKERIIPLLPEMIAQLQHYIVLRKKIDQNDNFLFLTKKGKKTYEALVYRVINTYFSPVSTKVKRSPHVLRHTFATQLLNQGADLNGVKELLGHASLASTQVYTHNDIKRLKDAYKKAHPRNK